MDIACVYKCHACVVHALNAQHSVLKHSGLMSPPMSLCRSLLPLRKECDDTKVALEAARAAAALAEKLRQEAEDDVAEQRRSNQATLERLLAEQRRSFELERDQLRKQNSLGADHYREIQDSLEKELEAARAESTALHTELTASREEGIRHAKEVQEAKVVSQGLKTALATLRDESDGALRELHEAREEIFRLEKELSTAKKAQRQSPPKPPSPEKKRVQSSVLPKLDLDESDDAPPITEQIATALRSNSARVLDLFRECKITI